MQPHHKLPPEPAKAELVRRGIRQRDAAQLIGVSPTLLSAALNCRTVPPPRVRAGLAELLTLPVEQLFHASTLARCP